MAALGSAITAQSGDNSQVDPHTETDEKQKPRKTTCFCGLGPLPHSGLRAPVPDVAGGEPHLEKFLLVVDAGFLEQGPKVPEHAHVGQPVAVLSVDLQHRTQDTQVESRGIRMT